MRGCALWIVVLACAFVAAPIDAQMAAVGLLRGVWEHEAGRSIALGAFGASFGALLWINLGWNMRVDAEERSAIERAQASARQARRGLFR